MSEEEVEVTKVVDTAPIFPVSGKIIELMTSLNNVERSMAFAVAIVCMYTEDEQKQFLELLGMITPQVAEQTSDTRRKVVSGNPPKTVTV